MVVRGIVGATELPAWAAIAVAVVAGLFGLLAGAASAAVVTTRNERKEKRRDKMTEAITFAEEGLSACLVAAEALFSKYLPSDDGFDYQGLKREAHDVRKTLRDTRRRIGRLWIFFPVRSSTALLAQHHADLIVRFVDRLTELAQEYEAEREATIQEVSKLTNDIEAHKTSPIPQEAETSSLENVRLLQFRLQNAQDSLNGLPTRYANAFKLLDQPNANDLVKIWQAANVAIRARKP